MKVSPSEDFLNDIRSGISGIKEKLQQIREERKSLIEQIRGAKANIRLGEKHCSMLQNSKLDDAESFLRNHLNNTRSSLMTIRRKLLSLDVHRELEVSRYRILHRELDKLGVPFDPIAKNKSK